MVSKAGVRWMSLSARFPWSRQALRSGVLQAFSHGDGCHWEPRAYSTELLEWKEILTSVLVDFLVPTCGKIMILFQEARGVWIWGGWQLSLHHPLQVSDSMEVRPRRQMDSHMAALNLQPIRFADIAAPKLDPPGHRYRQVTGGHSHCGKRLPRWAPQPIPCHLSDKPLPLLWECGGGQACQRTPLIETPGKGNGGTPSQGYLGGARTALCGSWLEMGKKWWLTWFWSVDCHGLGAKNFPGTSSRKPSNSPLLCVMSTGAVHRNLLSGTVFWPAVLTHNTRGPCFVLWQIRITWRRQTEQCLSHSYFPVPHPYLSGYLCLPLSLKGGKHLGWYVLFSLSP